MKVVAAFQKHRSRRMAKRKRQICILWNAHKVFRVVNVDQLVSVESLTMIPILSFKPLWESEWIFQDQLKNSKLQDFTQDFVSKK